MLRYIETTVTTDEIVIAALKANTAEMDAASDYASLWQILSKAASKAAEAND